MAFGWGGAVGKVLDWLPGRVESYKNQINKLEKEIDDLLTKEQTPDITKRVLLLTTRLRDCREKLKNAA